MPSEKKIEAAQKVFLDARPYMGSRELATLMLTAAEQAEPAPAARSDAVKEIVEEVCEGWCKESGGRGSFRDCFGCRIHRDLSTLEPAEPVVDAEREFNEVLNEAEAFNDALPERMRKNARDWLRPDDGPAADAERVESCPDCAGSGYSNHPDSGQVCYRCDGQGSYTHPPESRLREAAREAVNCITHHAEDNENTRWVLSLLNAALAQGCVDESA